ncbi:DUF4265 domain-containing protein [Streptomyces liangshanensis]|uniref:DUF4265 domain-containing protein n=1 Tax=Streptomyces liangshanensis TaxID=2717324 RepID=UPI001FBA11F7|nr:DUF4265 domain-containing protein [Streptomyces liangshanensis]
MTSISDDHVKVFFRRNEDEAGWPPASVESLWAVDLGDGTVRPDNIPWFVRGIADHDIIRVETDDEGVPLGRRDGPRPVTWFGDAWASR